MIRVLLAEDHRLVRGALVALLGFEPDIEVVSEVDSGDAVVPAALAVRPDVAVLDIDLPGMDGLTAAGRLRERLADCRVLILTSFGHPANLLRAREAGVEGFMLKDAPPQQLAAAIRSVAAGERVIDAKLAAALWDAQHSPLTPRETEVLRLTAAGAPPVEIAGRLFLSVGTVRNYLTAVITKLNARGKVDAVRIAQESGWL
ncbi:response regulator transcription factor [Hamadaea tsunoensis]|uniref:response regulator transcription factor n=1 Tax=Hamadaea tsunoensis TaxID=53368 RepID=UPI0004133972|nr:response regulator transcription factor [Hamadaea tsunoensis]